MSNDNDHVESGNSPPETIAGYRERGQSLEDSNTDLHKVSSSSPPEALRRVLHLFEGEFPFTSIRVKNPDLFEPLPARFTIVRKTGAYWLRDSAAPKAVRA